jgi:carboxymethylenebutenolidase
VCFPYDSTPPIQSISGSAISSTDLILTSDDGTKFLAYHAVSDKPGGAGVIVLPDVRGIFGFYKDLADRFAEQGFDAVTIDYFGRTAGTGERPEEFDFMPHVAETKVPNIAADARAAADVLRSGDANKDLPLFTVGFCFGGSNSWILTGAGIGLSGAVGFYGHPTRLGRDGSAPPIDRIDSFNAPLLGLMGGADQGIPLEEVEKFDQALDGAGLEHDIHVYPGAPHSFFDRRFEEFADTSEDAWGRVLGFIRENSVKA